MEQVSATRSELLARRARIGLASQGRDLLKERRSALVREFHRLGASALESIDVLDRDAADAGRFLGLAVAAAGLEPVESAALAAQGERRGERAHAQRRRRPDRRDREGGGRAGADRSRLQPRGDERAHRRGRRALRGRARQAARRRRARALGPAARRRDRADDAADERARARGRSRGSRPSGRTSRSSSRSARWRTASGCGGCAPRPGARRAGDDGATDPRPARWTPCGGSRARSRSATTRATRPTLRSTRARAEAERLLAEARAPGADAGRRRRAAVLAEAEAEAAAIRAAGEPRRDELRERVRRRAGRAGRRAHRAAASARRRSRVLVPMTKVQILGRRREVERARRASCSGSASWRSPTRAPAQAVDELGGEEARSARRERAPSPRGADRRAAREIPPSPRRPTRSAGRAALDAGRCGPSWSACRRRSRRSDRRAGRAP